MAKLYCVEHGYQQFPVPDWRPTSAGSKYYQVCRECRSELVSIHFMQGRVQSILSTLLKKIKTAIDLADKKDLDWQQLEDEVSEAYHEFNQALLNIGKVLDEEG